MVRSSAKKVKEEEEREEESEEESEEDEEESDVRSSRKNQLLGLVGQKGKALPKAQRTKEHSLIESLRSLF